jgi:hypothetical protein
MAVIDVKVEQPLGRFCWIYLWYIEGILLGCIMGFGDLVTKLNGNEAECVRLLGTGRWLDADKSWSYYSTI